MMYKRHYRIHNNKTGEQLFPDSINYINNTIVLEDGSTHSIHSPDIDIFQCTYRKDNAGEYVYEGDRVRDTTDDKVYEVYWEEQFAEFRVRNENEDWQLSKLAFFLIENTNEMRLLIDRLNHYLKLGWTPFGFFDKDRSKFSFSLTKNNEDFPINLNYEGRAAQLRLSHIFSLDSELFDWLLLNGLHKEEKPKLKPESIANRYQKICNQESDENVIRSFLDSTLIY